VVNRILVFIGWGLSSMSFILVLAGLTIPGAGKFISLAFVGWALIFCPPLWKKTIKYNLPKNIGIRVVAFFLLPIIFAIMSMIGGYQPESNTVSVSSSPIETEVSEPLSKNIPPQPETSSVSISSTANPLPKDVNPEPEEIQSEVGSINVFSSPVKTEESPLQKNTSPAFKETQQKAAISSVVASTNQPAINALKSKTSAPKKSNGGSIAPLSKDVNPAPKEIQSEVSSINVSSPVKTEESPLQKNTSPAFKETPQKAATSSIVASTNQPATNTLKSKASDLKEQSNGESMAPLREATQGQGCSCPYDLDKRGHLCGRRSAYSKPGGASPACYRKDR
jgi:hypothetical protein